MIITVTMANKISSFVKYWFAVGYHAGMTGKNLEPSSELRSYIEDEYDQDIFKEYQKGRDAGEHDRTNYINTESN